MGLARHSPAPRRLRLEASAWTSFAVLVGLLAACTAYEALGGDPGPPGRRTSSYPDDLVIDRPYGEASNRGLVFLHIIGICYMLLGINTVCDVHFCSALDLMVDRWNIKPDVAGATFMAAGGSAPELFTSLLGTLVTQDDVGFGTIVGSAIFNVLFVIGLCGWVAKEEITLTWWPLFRDALTYMIGLSALAWVASDNIVRLWEAIMLFAMYICYCVLMYNNARIEVLFDKQFWQAKRMSSTSLQPGSATAQPPSVCPQFISVKPHYQAEPPAAYAKQGVLTAWGDTPEEGRSRTSSKDRMYSKEGGLPVDLDKVESVSSRDGDEGSVRLDGGQEKAEKTGIRSSVSSEASHASAAARHRGRRISSLKRVATMIHEEEARRHDDRMAQLGLQSEPVAGHGASVVSSNVAEISPVKEVKESSQESFEDLEAHPAPTAGANEAAGKGEQEGEEEEEEEEDLLAWPTGGLKDKIIWCIALPVYIPLYYLIPMRKDLYLVTFSFALIAIMFFSFFMVWWVEILGQVLSIDPVLMGYTLLAAGTSIPDAVSSMAVARMGEGDMSVSSSIGSNIFDILVGLPLPWMIKLVIDTIAGRTAEVRFNSPYLTVFVLMLLFMVFLVVLAIHLIGWKLSRTLGACMAALYVVFLALGIVVEKSAPEWLRF